MFKVFGAGVGLFGMFFCLFGCLFLAIAGGIYGFDQNSRSNMVLTTGTVTSLSTSESRDSDGFTTITYCPEVEYTTADGQTVSLDVNECSSPPQFKVGDPVELYYDPQNPQSVQLKGSVRNLAVLIFEGVLGLLGLVFAVIGGVILLGGLFVASRRLP